MPWICSCLFSLHVTQSRCDRAGTVPVRSRSTWLYNVSHLPRDNTPPITFDDYPVRVQTLLGPKLGPKDLGPAQPTFL